MHNQSEVAYLMQQIDQEWQAAFYGMHGLAQGISQHDFINARYSRIGQLQDQLAEHVGEEQAATLVVQSMDRK